MKILIPNLGSTSLKYQLLDMEGERVLARGKIERIGSAEAAITTWNTAGEPAQTTASIPNHRVAVEFLN